MSPTIEAFLVKTVAAGVTSYVETVPVATISTRVTNANTLAPSSNDRKDLVINFSFIYRVFFL